MTIKGFKVGQTVVIVEGNCATTSAYKKRTEAVITKVGRKYVTAKPACGGCETKYQKPKNERCGYLIERVEIGSPRLLLPSVHAADVFCETEELRFWLMKAAEWNSVRQYSLEQLREVKRILECVRSENGPLALTELECMIGEKVWVERAGVREYGIYATVESIIFDGNILHLNEGTCYNYGEAWQAYRQKPQGKN